MQEETRAVRDMPDKDAEVFRPLVLRYQNPIFNLMLRFTGSLTKAADLTQETFTRACARLKELSAGQAFLSVVLCHRAQSGARPVPAPWPRGNRGGAARAGGGDRPAAAGREVGRQTCFCWREVIARALPRGTGAALETYSLPKCLYPQVCPFALGPVRGIEGDMRLCFLLFSLFVLFPATVPAQGLTLPVRVGAENSPVFAGALQAECEYVQGALRCRARLQEATLRMEAADGVFVDGPLHASARLRVLPHGVALEEFEARWHPIIVETRQAGASAEAALRADATSAATVGAGAAKRAALPSLFFSGKGEWKSDGSLRLEHLQLSTSARGNNSGADRKSTSSNGEAPGPLAGEGRLAVDAQGGLDAALRLRLSGDEAGAALLRAVLPDVASRLRLQSDVHLSLDLQQQGEDTQLRLHTDKATRLRLDDTAMVLPRTDVHLRPGAHSLRGRIALEGTTRLAGQTLPEMNAEFKLQGQEKGTASVWDVVRVGSLNITLPRGLQVGPPAEPSDRDGAGFSARFSGSVNMPEAVAILNGTVDQLGPVRLHGRQISQKGAADGQWRWKVDMPGLDLASLGELASSLLAPVQGWSFSGGASLTAMVQGGEAEVSVGLDEVGFMSADGEILADRLRGELQAGLQAGDARAELELSSGEALYATYYCDFSRYPMRLKMDMDPGDGRGQAHLDWDGLGVLQAAGSVSGWPEGTASQVFDPSSSDAQSPSSPLRASGLEAATAETSGPAYSVQARLNLPDLSGPFRLLVAEPLAMADTEMTGAGTLRLVVNGRGENARMRGALNLSDAVYSSPDLEIAGVQLDLPLEYVFGDGGGLPQPDSPHATAWSESSKPGASRRRSGERAREDASQRSSQLMTGRDVHAMAMQLARGGGEQVVPRRWGELRVGSITSGYLVAEGLRTPAALLPGGLLLPGDLSAQIYGGAVELSDTRVDAPLSSAWRLLADLSLRDVSMAAMPTGSVLLDGTLGGELGRVEMTARRLKVPRALSGTFFGGSLRMDGLYMTDPFRPSREYGCSITVDDLDLERLSGALGIGRITGRLDLDADDLVMAYGQPAAFDLTVRSDREASEDRTVSLEAVNSLSVIGTGSGLAGVGVGVFASFFKEFSYKYIGFRCVLKNDSFRVQGLRSEGGQEYLIRKPFLFGINVVNSNPNNQISFSDMLERIERVVNPSSSMEFGTPETTEETQ